MHRPDFAHLLPRALTPLGVDVGSRCAWAAQLRRRVDGWQLVGAIRVAAGDDLPKRMLDGIDRKGMSGRRVILAAASAAVRVEMLDLPARSENIPLDILARAEMTRLGRFAAEPFQFASWEVPAPARATGTTLIGVAVKDADTQALLSPWEAEGFEIEGVKTDRRAVATAVLPLCDASGITAVIDLAYASAGVQLICNSVVAYQRELADGPVGLLHRTLAEEFDVAAEEAEYIAAHLGIADSTSPEEKLERAKVATVVEAYLEGVATEVEASVAYARHRYPDRPITKLLIVGEGATVAGVDAWLAKRLGIASKIVRPADIVTAAQPWADDPCLVRAIGLAISSAADATFDLTSAGVKQAVAKRRRIRTWSAVCVAQLAVLGAIAIGARLGPGAQGALAEVAAANQSTQTAQAQLQSVRVAAADVKAVRDATTAVADAADFSLLLAMISRSLSETAALHSVELTPAPNQKSPSPPRYVFALKGNARNQESVSDFLLKLQDIAVLKNVKLLRTTRTAAGIDFEINAAVE